MRSKKLAVMLNALVLSVSIFADGIEGLEQKAITCDSLSLAGKSEQSWISTQNNLLMAPRFIVDAESSNVTGTNESFLWGLMGFGLTVVPGVVCLVIGGQGGQEFERIPKVLSYGLTGFLIGAGVSLTSSLVFSFSQGRDVFTPTYYGILVGLGTLTIVTVAMYPEIPGAILGAIIVLPLIYFINHL
jgi:hypothetical protein